MSYIRKIRNIGIFAHVDAGKTSLTESLLYHSNSVKEAGSVDKGTCQTDFYDIEKERGISVISATTFFTWKDHTINLIDTPGHIDFSSEVERSISVIDAVILVISAIEGIQPQTELILEAAQKLNLPTLIFINKIDRPGSDTEKVINDLISEKGLNLFCMQAVEDEETIEASVKSIWTEQLFSEYPDLIELIAGTDDGLLEKYLFEKDLSFSDLNLALKNAVSNRKVIPVLCGSAKTGTGINNLLDSLIEYVPAPNGNIDNPLSAKVFSIRHDKDSGRLAGVRVYDGSISVMDEVKLSDGTTGKVNRIRFYKGEKFEQRNIIRAGEVGFLAGIPSIIPGEGLGEIIADQKRFEFDAPLLLVKVLPQSESELSLLIGAMLVLNSEDPNLEFEKEEKEIIIKTRGKIQSEIIQSLLKTRFGLDVSITNPEIIYKETIAKPGYGFAEYTMPKPCWAVMKFLIEPLKRGEGVKFSSQVSVDKIKKRYQNEIENSIMNALQQGIKGWEVTDVSITLVDGEDHEMHSRPGDFIISTNMAIMTGLNDAGTDLLEPIMKFRLTSPEDHLGAIAGDLHKMRGEFDTPVFKNGVVVISGKVPLSTSVDYPVRLGSLTSGKGSFSSRLDCYMPISDELGKIRPYRGVSPLDRSKYILKMRGAIKE